MDLGIPHLTVYALSLDNMRKREPRELSLLFELLIQVSHRRRISASHNRRPRVAVDAIALCQSRRNSSRRKYAARRGSQSDPGARQQQSAAT